MVNPYRLMLSGKSHSDVLNALATLAASDQEPAAAEIGDEEVPEIATYMVTTCQLVGTLKTLLYGGFLQMFLLLVDRDGRRELFAAMLEDLDLSRPQAYRCIAAWKAYGADLLNAPKLRKFFCSESLKILAEDRTPTAAREEALALARDGERITIKRAEELRQKHGMVPVVPAAASVTAPEAGRSKRKSTRSASAKWTFAGSVVRIQVTPTTATETPEIPAVINDLQAAIDQLRNGSSQLVA